MANDVPAFFLVLGDINHSKTWQTSSAYFKLLGEGVWDDSLDDETVS